MEAGGDIREQKMYESLLMDIKSGDRRRVSEAMDEASDLVGRKERKTYHETFLDAVLDKIAKGPPIGEGPDIKFVRDVAERYGGNEKTRDFAHISSVLDRIAAMPEANVYARQLSLETIFSNPTYRITSKTVETVKAAFESPKKSRKESFELKAIDLAVSVARKCTGNKEGQDKPFGELYKFVAEEVIKGNLDEETSRGFVVSLTEHFKTDLDVELLEKVRDSEFLAEDIRKKASEAFKYRR